MQHYIVTRKFTGGTLVGLTHTEITAVERRVGQVVDKPVAGSPYIITGCEPVTPEMADILRQLLADGEIRTSRDDGPKPKPVQDAFGTLHRLDVIRYSSYRYTLAPWAESTVQAREKRL